MKALLFFFLHLFYGIFVSLFNCFFVHVLTLLSYVHKTQKMPANWCIYKLMFYIYLTFQNITHVN